MTVFFQLLFVALLATTAFFVFKRARRIAANISLGKTEPMRGKTPIKDVLLFALGQKKMFNKPLVAIMHLVLYVSFFVVNVEFVEIVLDGLLGTHRLFAPALGDAFYPAMVNFFELLAAAVIVACVVFLIRRNVTRVARLHGTEMTQWPKTDANLILVFEIVLMMLFLTMNATDTLLQERGVDHYFSTGDFLVSSLLKPLFAELPSDTLVAIERTAWWLHIIGILGFAVYITYSKHLHIVLGFANIYYSNNGPSGAVKRMPVVEQEVQHMMAGTEPPATDTDPERFGAKDVMDLSRHDLRGAYSCTECGRCTQACPANATGKLLSPRKIMMDTRDRMEEVGDLKAKGQEINDNTLFEGYVLMEELLACTSCNACVEVCPVGINPLNIIYEMRRYAAMEESKSPAAWNQMFANVEGNGAPWTFPASQRNDWMNEE